jgi:hypothetical protein
LITNVAELRLQGKSWFEKLDIPDVDLYIDKSGKRFIPLLRLLRELKASGNIEFGVVTFSIRKGAKAQIDLNKKLLILDSEIKSIAIITGISDLSGKAEAFVHEDVISSAFNIDFTWSDVEYAYKLTTTAPLRIFEEMQKSGKIERLSINQLSTTLPETEPAKDPENSRRIISIIDAGLRLDTRTIENSERSTSSSVKPDVTFYGQLLGGNYYLQLTEEISYPDGDVPKFPLWIEDGLWSYETSTNAVRAGDTVIGWSDLVVPSTKFTGVVVRGLYGNGINGDGSKQFLSGNRFNFMAEKGFSGYAPLGSIVEIHVNNVLIDSTIVDETQGAPPGQGWYTFSATGLMNRAMNEIRIVIIQPDGTRDETIENIVGSTALLPPGQTAYALGIGTKREERNRETDIHGVMAGAGYYYGLNRDATFGLSLATQDDFVQDFNQSIQQRLDKRSYLGQTLAYRVVDNLLFREEAAMNYEHESGDTSQAATLALDYITQPLLLSSYLFNYSAQYSNGSTPVSNRQGYALYGAPTFINEVKLAATFAQISEMSGDRQEQYMAAQARLPPLISRSDAMLRFDHIAEENSPLSIDSVTENSMYSFGLKSGPWSRTSLEMEYTWGDRINPASTSDLRYGISIPMMGSIPSYGSRLKIENALSGHSRINLTYRDYGQSAESVELGLSRTPRRANTFDMALRYRRDLTRSTDSADINIEYPFDFKRKYLIGVNANYNQLSDNMRYNLYLSMRDLFFVDGIGVGRVGGERYIQPQAGGLKGFVYLDANANGHYDDGEPGVGGVQIVVNGYQKYTSSDNGHFFIGRNSYQDEVMVELDDHELPAIYTITQGRQRAKWQEHIFTRVNLGVAVLSSISGEVSLWHSEKRLRGLPGVIVKAIRIQDGTFVGQSITDGNGVYYLGELKPGEYELVLEPDSVPPALKLAGEPPRATLPVSLKPMEIENTNIRLINTP